ncbi:MAG: hypothetical protein VKQ33_13355, partial [Candidatus Sericytochromatia bacterium]|nr:hypothetical protein [Candidatus Sericytochromatia bacterium]
ELVTGRNPLKLAPGEILDVSASVILGPKAATRPVPFRFRLVDQGARRVVDVAPATFVAPGQGAS